MDAAKAAINKFTSKSGRHTTEVDEDVNSAVTNETIKPHRHEETTQAVDREVHQDHYHTTVQPLQHKEVLPEKHAHQMMPTQEREVHHGDSERTKASIDAEAAKFRDTQQVAGTTHSTSQGAAVGGEHVHHHVHERVQPVINKETVQPEVVHTTVPIHETHHAQAEHHGLSTLPTKTLDEFTKLGGKVTGAGHRHEEYEGHPRPYNPEMQTSRSHADVDPSSHDGLHGSHGVSSGNTGTTGHTGLSGTTGTTGSTRTAGTDGLPGTTGTRGSNVSGIGATSSDYTSGHSGTSGIATSHGVDAHHGNAGRTPIHNTMTSGNTDTYGGDRSLPDRSLEQSTGGYSTGGSTTHGQRDTDNSSSTNTGRETHHSDAQHSSQGRDPNLVEGGEKGLKGTGVDGSHSAVFGLTPDGHVTKDTSSTTTRLEKTPSDKENRGTSGDTGSRAATGGNVAEQMRDPRVNEPAHGGNSVSTHESTKPGAGTGTASLSQGMGQVRPNEHGASGKVANKLDPTTDSDRDGKTGIMD